MNAAVIMPRRVARARRAWQGPAMTDRTGPQAGGVFVALATVVGAIAGTIAGQPSIGVLAGVATGVALAIVVWLRDRR